MIAGANYDRPNTYQELHTKPAASGAAAAPQSHWLWDHLSVGGTATAKESSQLDHFLNARTVGDALRYWLGDRPLTDKQELALRINRDVAFLDELINAQLNTILHHPKFQKLESSWRGLQYLTAKIADEDAPDVEIRVLNVSWRELERDFERAIEFDQSQLFRKVYEDEFGKPGGTPYGLLIGDYEIHPRVTPEHPHDDLGIMRQVANVAAAAFCPFVASVSPTMFGLDDYTGLELTLDHERTMAQLEYLNWHSFRRTEDSRFVGLTLPRTLMRLPYDVDCSPQYRSEGSHVERFQFREDVSGPNRDKYLWGNACFAFAGVVIRAYARSGWFADIRGVQRGVDGGGLVTGLPSQSFATDAPGVALKTSTDVVITDTLEKQLSEMGFISLCDCKDTEFAAFYSAHSVQKPERYDRPEATRNAELSARIQYMLCVSRFAHYIKVLGREKMGAYQEAENLEHYLHDWIFRYVTPDAEASMETKSRRPLRDAQVRITDTPGRPGAFQCTMHLSPHFELEQLVASVRLTTEIGPPRIA